VIYIYNTMSQFTTRTMNTSEFKAPENVILRNKFEIEEIKKTINKLKRKYPNIFMPGGKKRSNRRRGRRSLKRKYSKRR